MTTQSLGSSGKILPLTRGKSSRKDSDDSGDSRKESPILRIVEDDVALRYDRIQEARGRIARRFYDQDEIRKDVTQALLAFFGLAERPEGL
jgi:hypothetical protein